ncbi:hypothetical protein H5410_028166 [Solanum commersonii]|uniref:Uncharacterized protein n=1 Tax=Solanum commersonii TaxID=4109 RepID=A0A9J5Z1W5_SOLCO|nr:hypothetical protein H5410_028166 [Solanum commersonii]
MGYLAHLFTTPLDVTKTKRPKNMHGPTLNTSERNSRDDLITMQLVWDDAPTDEDKRRTMSDSEFDPDANEGDLLALEGTDSDVDMDE